MKIPGFFHKPRWLSKDAATRRQAVLHDTDAELLAQLARMAKEDPDADVRIAALKRQADPGVAQSLARDDADPNVRAQAHALWMSLLTGTHAASPPLSERVRLLKVQDDTELFERVARHAREPELRQAALERITRPALLIERALEDPDVGIRLALVERIDDETLLARIAERARKSDKQVNRHARERIDALRIARGDDATLEQRARALCERMERLVREAADADTEAELAARWSEVETVAPSALRVRFDAARHLLLASRQPPAVAGAVSALPEEDIAAPLSAQEDFAAAWVDEASREYQYKQHERKELIDDLAQALHVLDAHLKAGESTQAHAAKSRIDALRREIEVPLPPTLAHALANSENRYAELVRWQHWGDDQRRRQLCEDIEALPGSGQHPDAVASRVRDAQTEWTHLDAISARPSPLARRFHAACRAAIAPTREYFKKRHELREAHGQEIKTLLERLDALTDDNADWAALTTLRRETAVALHGLDRIEPRERKAFAQRLKTHLVALDTRISQQATDVESAKETLIAQARALLGEGNLPRGVVASVRTLQQRWQRAGNGRRARDQAQWAQFRTAIDAVFEHLNTEKAERSAREAELRTQAEGVIAEIEALAAAETTDRGAFSRAQAAWQALHAHDEDLSRRFTAAQSSLRDAITRRERAHRHARFHAWHARYELCRAAESASLPAEELTVQWAQAAASDIAADTLAARLDAALAGHPQAPKSDEMFRDVLIDLELLSGAESPAEDRDRRRTRQIERLSARMSGAATNDVARDMTELLARWSALGPCPHAAFQARIQAAFTTLLETLP
ncbi:MAG: DUF349 domain-containing protein [Rhodanobacter sp.]|jgi:hypothetical protein|nr:DUF349 domain-containing protein [Rhodanobacter sp.]